MLVLEELVGQTIDEKYHIETQLGQGGMGAVYLATHVGTGRPVAVKVIAPQFMDNVEFVERFKLEARAAGQLRHPNIVNVTDFGFSQVLGSRIAYLVMEYLNGCSLGDMLAERTKLELGFVVDIVEQVCLAIEAAHKKGIVHRDLKPDNIWLEPNGRGGYNVKVLDFGLAKLHDGQSSDNKSSDDSKNNRLLNATSAERRALKVPNIITKPDVDPEAATGVMEFDTEGKTGVMPINRTDQHMQFEEAATAVIKDNLTKANSSKPDTAGAGLTRVGTLLGTPLYMSPEQCHGTSLDQRSDLYSLAVITYQMLTGETPFQGNIYQLVAQHQTAIPPAIIEKRKDLPKHVGEVVMQALSKNPIDRPRSAKVFAGLLRARSEGISVAIRQALGLYTSNFSTFMKLSIFINIYPALFGVLLSVITNNTPSFLVILLSASVIAGKGIFAIVHENLRVLPYQPLTAQEVIEELNRQWGIDLKMDWKGAFELYRNLRRVRKESRSTLNLDTRSVVQNLPKRFRNIQILFFMLTLLGGGIFGFASIGAMMLLAKIFPALAAFTKVVSWSVFALSFYTIHSFVLPLSATTYSVLYFKERQALGEEIEEGFDSKIADIALLK